MLRVCATAGRTRASGSLFAANSDYSDPLDLISEPAKTREWWALVDDLRTFRAADPALTSLAYL